MNYNKKFRRFYIQCVFLLSCAKEDFWRLMDWLGLEYSIFLFFKILKVSFLCFIHWLILVSSIFFLFMDILTDLLFLFHYDKKKVRLFTRILRRAKSNIVNFIIIFIYKKIRRIIRKYKKK
jgi:hypothetical protein